MARLVIHLDVPDVDPTKFDPEEIAEELLYGEITSVLSDMRYAMWMNVEE